MTKFKIQFLFVLICLIWGSTWVAIKIGLDGVPPFLGAGLRFLLSTAIVGIALVGRRTPIRLTRADWICIWTLGVLVFWLDYAAVYWAETRISSGLTAILFSTMPLMTALLSAFWTRTEALGGRKVAGILIGGFGTVLLFWTGEDIGAAEAFGMLAALGASFCAAINLVVLKYYGKDSDPYVLNAFGMGIGAVCLLTMSAALEHDARVSWSTRNVLALVYLSVFGSVIAFTAYYALIKVMDATLVSLSTLVIPIVALVLGRVLLEEPVSTMAAVGIATIIGGVALVLVPPPRATKVQSSVRI
jgi:drug/metabolite transporter (DMT)-like permease